MKKSLVLLLFIIPMFTFLNAQTTSSEKFVVKVGWMTGKYAPDTTGIRKAFDQAVTIKRLNPGQFSTVEFESGVYSLARGIKLRDSVNIKADGCTFKGTDTVRGTFYDDSVKVTTSIMGNHNITNIGGVAKNIKIKRATSQVLNLSDPEYFYFMPYARDSSGTWKTYITMLATNSTRQITLYRSDVGAYIISWAPSCTYSYLQCEVNSPTFELVTVDADGVYNVGTNGRQFYVYPSSAFGEYTIFADLCDVPPLVMKLELFPVVKVNGTP